MASSKEQIWERQPGESAQAFEAFRIYRDLGLKRTNQKVSEQLSKSRQLISRWKQKYDWDERVRAYDTELDRAAHREAIKDLKDMTSRHIKISMQLQKKALEALQRISSEDMSIRDVKDYIKMATDLERLNRLGATSRTNEDIQEDNDDHMTLADSIVDAYRKRMKNE